MIIRDQPSPLTLFFTMHGSVVPRILPQILAVTILSAGIILVDRLIVDLPGISLSAIGVFGVALSLFLGFRNNAAYSRWWEARKLWGALIGDIRTLARHAVIFLPEGQGRAQFLQTAVAFAHLHRSFLRGDDVRAEVSGFEALTGVRNPADAALRDIGRQLAEMDQVDGFGRLALSQVLGDLGMSQAGCERIATTPLPFVYSLLVRRTTYLYCLFLPFALLDAGGVMTPLIAAIVAYVFFGLQAVTNELEHPFSDGSNGLPLSAMCRVIEISVAEALNETPPEPLQAENAVLM